MTISVRCGNSRISARLTLCRGRFNYDIVQASSTVIWTPVSGPSTALTLNDTFVERIGSPDELIVPSCKGLSLPTRPKASANFSKISEVWLPESSKGVYFNPTGGHQCYGYDLQQDSRGVQFTDEVPTKTGAAAFKVEKGEALWGNDENWCCAVD